MPTGLECRRLHAARAGALRCGPRTPRVPSCGQSVARLRCTSWPVADGVERREALEALHDQAHDRKHPPHLRAGLGRRPRWRGRDRRGASVVVRRYNRRTELISPGRSPMSDRALHARLIARRTQFSPRTMSSPTRATRSISTCSRLRWRSASSPLVADADQTERSSPVPALPASSSSSCGATRRLRWPSLSREACVAKRARRRSRAQVRTGKSEVTQDVFVRVKKKHDMDAIVEPLCPDPNVRQLSLFRRRCAIQLSTAAALIRFTLASLIIRRYTSFCQLSG